MHVALVNHTGEISGAEVSLLGTADALAEIGVRILLIVPESGTLATRARAAGHRVRTVALPAPRMTRDPFQLAGGTLGLARGAVRLAGVIRHEGVHVVHANSVRAGVMALFGRPLHRRPVVWSVRDFVPGNPVGLVVRWIASVGASRIVGNSNAVSRDFARWSRLRRKSQTVYPGVSSDAFDGSRTGDFRQAWGMAPSTKVVGCVGQIAPWKRVHDVITAFGRIAAELSSACLVIVGAAMFRPENQDYLLQLRRQVTESGLGDRVVFAGHQENVDRVFRSFDVLVHAAEREPFGRVLVEAMAQRVPVVAAADGGIPEIVRDGETGFLVPVGNTDAMSVRVLHLLRDDDLRRRMGERGRARVLECFRTDQGARDLVEIYRAVQQSPA